jgi:cell division protein FtsW
MNVGGRGTARGTGAGFDGLILVAALALSALGAVMVYSASAVVAETRLHAQFYFLVRQLVAAGLGLVLLVVALRAGTERIERVTPAFAYVTLAGLFLVLVPGIGRMAGGARRWIDLGVFSFQPAEAAKIALVLWLARALARVDRDRLRDLRRGYLPLVGATGLVMVLCLAERDFGSCVVLFAVLCVLLYAAGARLAHLGATFAIAGAAGWWAIAGTAYRVKRIDDWLHPFEHRDGGGYQMVESLLGIGNGGWLGQGLGQGKGKLFYLPAAHTDFIGAVVAEELGLAGLALLVALYALFVWRGLRAAARAGSAFGCYAALGITALVGVQALLNLSVVLVLLPTKGLTLPFVSYGGSSLMTLLFATGILLSISTARGGFARPGEHALRTGVPAAVLAADREAIS